MKSKLLEIYTLLQDWFVLFHIHESDDDDDDMIITTSFLSEIFTDILTK